MEEKVRVLLQQALDENPSLFLIDLSIQGDNEIKVVIDGDHGVTVEDCIAVSRKIEHNLDREQHDFSLDILSAGATTPFTNIRQYKKNIGRNVEIKTTDGKTIEGLLETVSDTEIMVSWKTREPKPVGKGKITVQKEETLTYDGIVNAKVKIKF